MSNAPDLAPNSGGAVANSILANPKAIAGLGVRAMFPCLVFGTVFVQYRNEAFINQLLNTFGQALMWFALLFAAIIVLVMERAVRIFLFSFIAIVALRIARMNLGPLPGIELGYHFATGLLFAVAGATILIHRSDVLHRQMMMFVALSIPIMLIQILGEPWSHWLRTDHVGFVDLDVFGPLLFQDDDGAGFNGLQVRPSGLLHANVFLSIVMLSILAIHFSRWRDGQLKWSDVGVVTVVVLAMSKILLLSALVFSVLYLVGGPAAVRWRAAKLMGVAGLLVLIYAFMFPIAFAFNLSPTSAYFNFVVRLADVQAVMAGVPDVRVSIEDAEGVVVRSLAYETGEQSAFAIIARYWQLALGVALIAGMALIRPLQRMKRTRPDLAPLARNGLIAAFLALLITSFLGSPFFAFWAGGFVIMPFLIRSSRLPRSEVRGIS